MTSSHVDCAGLRGILAALLLALVSHAALAQSDFPNRPVRIIVPYAAGGSADILARLIAAGLQTTLGQSVLGENRSGASGNVGTVAGARAGRGRATPLLQTRPRPPHPRPFPTPPRAARPPL